MVLGQIDELVSNRRSDSSKLPRGFLFRAASIAEQGRYVDGYRSNRYGETMDLTVRIPDDIAERLRDAPDGGDLSRRALEGLALEELKAGRITEPELGRMLGLARVQIDGFLKPHGVYQDYTVEDFEKERAALKSLGLNSP